MELAVTIFQRRRQRSLEWFTVGLSGMDQAFSGATEAKVRRRLLDAVRKAIAKKMPADLMAIDFVPGRELEVVELELKVGFGGARTRIRGRFPLVVEPRPRGPGTSGGPLLRVFHPLRPTEWFVHEPTRILADEAAAYFRDLWADLEFNDIEELRADGRDTLRLVRLMVAPKALASLLKKKKKDEAPLLGAASRTQGEELLAQLGVNETQRAVDDRLDSGMPRMPYRAQLQQLVGGRRRQSVVLIGPSGVGKSTILRHFVHDLLQIDEYVVHRNLDKAQQVWRISGRRLIAGMSYLGQWEQRCVDLLEACRKHRGVLWVEDIHAWGRIGETRESERNLATFFRGPVARGELLVLAECTSEQWQRLALDAPGLAGAFTTLFVEPTDEAQTLRMLMHDARRLETDHAVAFDARCFRTIYEMADALGSGVSHPGAALELLRSLVGDEVLASDLVRAEREAKAGRKIGSIKAYREATGASLKESKDAVEAFMASGRWRRLERGEARLVPARSTLARGFGGDPGRRRIDATNVIRALARRTGMPEVLLAPERPLRADEVDTALAGQVMGQPGAVAAGRDLVLRLAAGMTDRGRPYGVLLFTGPTGTGKTEMAKCLAEYLYGDIARLCRFDMSEYSGPDAASRLIGDRFQPRGQLTSAVSAQPFSVVLLDEIEKADPSVLNLMLQLFDDGRLTDATGTVVDFSHTVTVMTSNLGAKASPSVGFGETATPSAQELDRAVRDFFPPELFNRIDHVVPFSALDQDAATSIARRELSRLLSRRGLTERDVFVRFTDSVVEQIVAQGFAARDGARSLKRWLEDHVGAWLADEISSRGSAAMRVFWLYLRDGALALHGEHLQEAPSPDDASPLEPMLDWNARQLRDRLPAALEEVERVLASSQLDGIAGVLRSLLSEASAGDERASTTAHHLEELRQRLLRLAEVLRTHVEYDPLLAEAADEALRTTQVGEAIEADDFAFGRRLHHDGVEVRVRDLDRRHLEPSLPLAGRPDFIDALAELYFLRLALRTAGEPSEHAVLVDLTLLTRPSGAARFEARGPGLLEWLADAYAEARGEVDAVIVVDDAARPHPVEPARLGAALAQAHTRIVLRIVGPAVRRFFAAEHGCHVRHGVASGREIVRVRVSGGLDVTPLDHVLAQQAARTRFVEALERGEELPPDPDGVEPIVRRYDFDPVAAGGLSPIVVEDYPLAHAISTRARSIGAVLPMLWLLAIGQAVAEEDA